MVRGGIFSRFFSVLHFYTPDAPFYSIGNGQRLQQYTGQRIDKVKWGEKKMQVKGNSLEARDVNEELQRQRYQIEDVHRRARANDIPVSH